MGKVLGIEKLGPIHNTHLNTIRHCERKFKYSFIDGIQIKQPSLPLARGSWLHYCLGAQFLRWGIEDKTLLDIPDSMHVDDLGNILIDPKKLKLVILIEDEDTRFYDLSASGMLDLLIDEIYSRLFDAEKEKYVEEGVELPVAVEKILTEYFYNYRDKFKKSNRPEILLVEHSWSREYKGVPFEGRLDYLIRDGNLLVCGDWKSTASTPHAEFKFMESQLHLYPWGLAPYLLEQGLEKKYVDNMAIEFDYLITKLPTVPSQNQDGTISKRKINTTYLTLVSALKDYEMKWSKERIERYLEDNGMDFFENKRLPRNKKVTQTILDEALLSAEVMDTLIQHPDRAIRSVDRSCSFKCEFLDLCKGELYGQNVSPLLKKNYEKRVTTHHAGAVKDE